MLSSPERELPARRHDVITIAFADAMIACTGTLLGLHQGPPRKVDA